MSGLYTVQEIIGKRVEKGVTEYQVVWEGYSRDQFTWEPAHNLKYVTYMIKQFEQKYKKGQNKKEKNVITTKKTNQQLNFRQPSPEPKPKKRLSHNFTSNDYPNSYEIETEQVQELDEINDELIENLISDGNYQEEEEVKDFRKKIKKAVPQPTLEEKVPDKFQTAYMKNVKNGIRSAVKNMLHNNSQSIVDTEEDEESQMPKKNQKPKLKKPEMVSTLKQKRDKQMEDSPILLKTLKNKIQNENEGLSIKQMYKEDDGEFEYLVSENGLDSIKTREFLVENYPKLLVEFYESKIQFVKIPKL